MNYRFGKHPAVFDPRTLRLRDYLRAAALPAPPAARAWDRGLTAFGMMGNDTYGDCTIAAAGHAIQIVTANAATEITIPDATIISTYFGLTGGQDTGLVELNVLRAWQQAGIAGHKAAAFAACSTQDVADVKACIDLLGFTYLGFIVPSDCLAQFEAGQPWDVTPNQTALDEGHAIIAVDYDATGGTAISWGKLQRFTWAWFQKWADEAYGVVLPEWVAANGESPSGLNLQQLLADVQQLQQAPDPAPPDPIAQWTTWQQQVADYVPKAYAAQQLVSAAQWQATLADYAPGIEALLAAAKSGATNLRGTDFALPPSPPPPPVLQTAA